MVAGRLGRARTGTLELAPFDPLWPMFPIFKAWPPAARGDVVAARAALGDFSVLDIVESTGTEGLAAAAVVFAVAGNTAQRSWTYERLLPLRRQPRAGRGCASYHAAVDHHLGALAASLGDMSAAEAHFRAALAMHERLGAAGWARLSEQALADLSATALDTTDNEFRLVDGLWHLGVPGSPRPAARRQGSAGPRDADRSPGTRRARLHPARQLETVPRGCRSGARRHGEEAEYKARLRALDTADRRGRGPRPRRASRPSAPNATALIHELAAATGLGGRARRLGDPAERARKTVSARVRDALSKIDQVHPQLARHLRDTVHMGTHCEYAPRPRVAWTLTAHETRSNSSEPTDRRTSRPGSARARRARGWVTSGVVTCSAPMHRPRCSVHTGRGGGAMGEHAPGGSLRLAELVAALSLGIDLGFGQPMEHVLRQCLIALRLAELAGLDDEAALDRLLHGAAGQRRLPHRRARAGEVVRRRHRAEGRQVRPRDAQRARARWRRPAAARRGQPAAAPLPARAGVRVSGHRDLDGMIDQHAAMARVAGEQLGLPSAVLDARRRLLRAVGRPGLAGGAAGRRGADRGADRAAGRVRRGRPPHRRRAGPRRRWRASGRAAVRPELSALLCADARTCPRRPGRGRRPGRR